MEVKPNQKLGIRLVRTTIRGVKTPNLATSSPTFCFNCYKCNNKSLTKRFQGLLPQRWNFIQIQGLSKGQDSPKRFLVHVVKEGETLTSISMQYGVSIQAIVAVNANILDVDFVLEGQHLNIPLDAKGPCWTNQSGGCNIHERCQSSLNIMGAHEYLKIFSMLSSQHIKLAKPTGYFLVLVPLIAFCIRCIIGTIHHKVLKESNHQAVNESMAPSSRFDRWKSVLSDAEELDEVHSESRPDPGKPLEDQSEAPFEDISHAYTKLEPAYLKFLSECGMSKWGYWRGGSLD